MNTFEYVFFSRDTHLEMLSAARRGHTQGQLMLEMKLRADAGA